MLAGVDRGPSRQGVGGVVVPGCRGWRVPCERVLSGKLRYLKLHLTNFDCANRYSRRKADLDWISW